jgi:hypothetical protein
MINRRSKVLQSRESTEATAAHTGVARARGASTVSWRQTTRGFSFQDEHVQAKLELVGESSGLRRVMLRGAGSKGGAAARGLLAVHSVEAQGRPPLRLQPGKGLAEARVRGRTVDVLMHPATRSAVRLHAYWRIAPHGQLDMETLASSADPLRRLEVITQSSYGHGEVLVLAAARGDGWVNVNESGALGTDCIVFPRDRDAGVLSLDGRYPAPESFALGGVFRYPITLYRPARAAWSYAEMGRPDDCVRMVVHLRGRGSAVSFGMFGLDLEKGVILRGLVRGLFLPRTNDTRQAIRAFERFASESPRLSV